jgi:hypothetical protein
MLIILCPLRFQRQYAASITIGSSLSCS